MEIVKNSAKDCYPAVQKTTLVIMERLQQVLQMEVSLGQAGAVGQGGATSSLGGFCSCLLESVFFSER